jgi:hypothetical protein
VAARAVLDACSARGAQAKAREEAAMEGLELTSREAEQQVRRAQRGAERDELLASLDELATWFRDLIAVSVGADSAVANADRLADLRSDVAARPTAGHAAEDAADLVRGAWRVAEEFNVNASLWLEALFVQLRRVFL